MATEHLKLSEVEAIASENHNTAEILVSTFCGPLSLEQHGISRKCLSLYISGFSDCDQDTRGLSMHLTTNQALILRDILNREFTDK